jgi:hypothetical protein
MPARLRGAAPHIEEAVDEQFAGVPENEIMQIVHDNASNQAAVGGHGADKQRRHGHDRGEVLVDLAVALADVTLILGVSLAIVDVLSAKPREWRVSEWARARWLTS